MRNVPWRVMEANGRGLPVYRPSTTSYSGQNRVSIARRPIRGPSRAVSRPPHRFDAIAATHDFPSWRKRFSGLGSLAPAFATLMILVAIGNMMFA